MPAGYWPSAPGGGVAGAYRPRYPAATALDLLQGVEVKLVPRLASPVGFLLALVFFLLPFVAVSCEAPGLGSVEISYTGVDLATNGNASVETVGEFGDAPAPPVQDGEDAPKPDVQVLTIITMVLLAAGLAVSLVPVARTRLLGAGAAAVLGATLLIITEAVAQSNLRSALQDAAAREGANKPGELPLNLTSSLLDDMVQSRAGFWLSLIAVLLVLAYNAGVLVWPRIRAATTPAVAQAPPPIDAPPPPPPPPVQPGGGPPPPQ